MNFFHLPLYLYEIMLCLIFSLFFLGKGKPAEKALQVFFFVLIGVELYAAYLQSRREPNSVIYNSWFPIEFSYYGLLVAGYILSAAGRRFSLILISGYLSFTVIYYAFFTTLTEFSTLDYLVGSLMLVVIMLFKLYEILNQAVIHNPFKNQIFWVIVGLLVVNLGSFFHLGLNNYLYRSNITLHQALQQLNIYLTEFQYLCIIIYFACRWTRNSHT